METSAIKFPENVLIIDVYFLNTLIADMEKYYKEKLQRPIENVNIPYLLDYLMLDMGVRDKENKCLVIWVYDAYSEKLALANPNDIATELNGKGFDDNIGYFEMIGAPCKDLVTRKDLALNILELTKESKEIKRLGVLSEVSSYDEEVHAKLSEMKDKETYTFVLDPTKYAQTESSKAESALFPILAGMGIQGNEL